MIHRLPMTAGNVNVFSGSGEGRCRKAGLFSGHGLQVGGIFVHVILADDDRGDNDQAVGGNAGLVSGIAKARALTSASSIFHSSIRRETHLVRS